MIDFQTLKLSVNRLLGSHLSQWRPRFARSLDLQAKVILVLIGVIVPTFLIITVAQIKLTGPLLKDEIRQVGMTSGKTLAAEIVSARLLQFPNPTAAVESRLQEILFSQPSIMRIDVVAKDPTSGLIKVVGTNVEDEPGTVPPVVSLVEAVTSEYHAEEDGPSYWEIQVPIEQRSRDLKLPRKQLGAIRLLISTQGVENLSQTLWKTTAGAAGFSVVCLILGLSFFLRKTIENDRLLRRAESQNLELTEQLHETQRQLMNMEKFAVMGQLTASFAHEIGTPLNAIGGHLQLLSDEVSERGKERLEILNGQVSKIEQIVKNFLQSTSKPSSQRQLVDLNLLVEKSLGIIKPRTEAMGVEVHRFLDRHLGPLRAVPIEMEQIFLNLLNNSMDSLRAKIRQNHGKIKLLIEVKSQLALEEGRPWAQIEIFDTGEGVPREDLRNIVKPFFTTKSPGEGTGLGLTICQQLANKHGGRLKIDSKEGSWTRVVLHLPFQSKGLPEV